MVQRLGRNTTRLPSTTTNPATNATTTTPSGPGSVSTDAPLVNGALPRTNASDETTAARRNGLNGLFRDHSRPVMAVMAGAMAVPMFASPAMATEAPTDTEAATETGDTAATSTVAEEFEPAKLKEYPLFKLFWNSDDPADGTAHQGLDEVTPEGVDTLVEFAMEHNLDGSLSAPGSGGISKAETDLIKAVLEHSHHGTFFELDALPKLYDKFGIEPATVHSVAESHAAAKTALAKILGVKTEALSLSYPEAGPTASTTYLAMDGKMAEPMSYIDQYREALGLPKGAEAYEKAPVLGWMMGVDKGHTKYGSFNEKKPFSTSGLNWGTLLFPGNEDVAKLPVKKGFDFPIDALTGFNRAVGGFAKSGDTIVPTDKDGNELTATVVIHKNAEGKAESWSATFKNDAGEDVAPQDVIGLIKDKYGNTKGDGNVTGSMNMGWWGFCDRNTAQRLYKSKFGIPNIDRDVTIEVNGKSITIPKDAAQKLLDVDVGDMVGRTEFVGSRFNDEPSKILLSSGKMISGKLKGFDLRMGPNATRVGGDEVIIRNSDVSPILGSVQVKSSYSTSNVDLADVETITKDAETGKVSIKEHGRTYTTDGELLTELDWSKATEVDGKLVLTNTKADPILGGELVVNMGGGKTERVKAADVVAIAGEMQNEMSITEYVKFIENHKGMYASDNSTGIIVSNGMRWTNKIDVDMHDTADTPKWAEGKTLLGTKGELKRQEGDKLMHINGMYKTEWSDSMNSQFTGWVQLDQNGKIINEGFLTGEPDFGWAADGPLNWNAKSSFNPFMTPQIRLQLLINGVEDADKLEGMAEKLNLPANWKTLRTMD